MPEAEPSRDEMLQKLLDENGALRSRNLALSDEVERLNSQARKSARESRIAASFLDKVSKAAEAKEALNAMLTEANEKQRAYTDMLLQSCPNIIALFDAEGRFVLCTDALINALDIPNFDYIRNLKYDEVLSKHFSDKAMETIGCAIAQIGESDEPVRFDTMIDFAHGGHPRFYSCEVRRAGTGSGILAVMVDLTDIMLEKQRSEAANNAKTEFLATMSHEIRTPMNAIIGMSEMLDRSEMQPKQKRYVSDIKRSSVALLSIINDILDFSKIEAGKMELVFTSFSIIGLLDNIGAMFTTLCRDKGLEFEYLPSGDMPETINGDETRIRQVLTNILSNAVKYTKQGRVTLTARAENGVLYFDIKDTGIGIREEDRVKLFRPFEQLDVRKNRDVVGTGLGLAITYNLCGMMGGDLWLDSVYGTGSVFHIKLPYTLADQTSDEPQNQAAQEFHAPRAKVLVVDDIEINLMVAEALLSTFDILPDLVQSGKDAIARVRDTQYDMIFMDHMMPVMDGVETTRDIRELGGWNDRVPIIALTANAITGVKQMFLANRLDDFLPKPLDINALNLCLRKWLPADVIGGNGDDERRYGV